MSDTKPEDAHVSLVVLGKRLSGPAWVGLVFAVIATILSLVGLARGDNLTLRNAVIAAVLGGGSWGLVSWAIAATVSQVDQDLEAGSGDDGETAG